MSETGKVHAVIFDLDGTLIDTEKYYRKCWPEAVEHFGYTMTDEQALSLRSLGRPYAPQRFKEWYGEDFDYEKVRAYRKERMEYYLKTYGITLKPGAKEILQWLGEHHIVTALATANDRERAERYLKKIGLYEYFDRVISADMVACGKPAKDIYAYACEQLKELPEHCMAVEDSPNGAMSAIAAGCKTVYIPDQTPVEEELLPQLFAWKENLLGICELFVP